jgi:hypothetical protein
MKTQLTNLVDERYVGYVPPHGRTLGAGASILLDGDLRSALAAGRNRYGRPAELKSLEDDCDNGRICLTEVVEDCCSSSSSSSSSV